MELCYAVTPDCGEVARRFYGVPERKIRLLSLGSETVIFHPVESDDDARERATTRQALGYADGVPRSASNRAMVRVGGANRRIAGRVCMDQIVVESGADPIAAGDVAVLFGPGTDGEPTADDWAEAAETINYEIVTRFGSARVPRVYATRGDHG